MASQIYRNILVIHLMHLGDLMLGTPVLAALRQQYPAARITLLADKKLADVVAANEHLDECLLIDKKGADGGIRGILRCAMRLRKRHYDLVINLHRNERASALAALSGGRRIVGYTKPGFSLAFDHVSPSQNQVMHEVQSHYAALRAAGVLAADGTAGLEMWIPPAAAEEAERLWREHFAPTDKVIALNIGASWATKRWIDDYFARVADTYLRRGYHIAVMGGPMDIAMVEECRARMEEREHPHLHIFTGQVSLGVLAGLLCSRGTASPLHPLHHDGLWAHARRRRDARSRDLHVWRIAHSRVLPLRCAQHLRPCARPVPPLPHPRVSARRRGAHDVYETDAA